MCGIAVSPRFGRTDPPPGGMGYEECLAEDIAAFHDQYGVSSSAIMARNTSTSFAFRLSGLMPQRVRRIVLLSTLVASPFLKASNVRSSWVSALVRTAHNDPALKRTIVAATVRSWKVLAATLSIVLHGITAAQFARRYALKQQSLNE
ncbi:MAG: pimeloyl-ACP methyl ester carboxylesterase [Gammaproteobacteria bacterium]|jgi:pimeloyl-ACP methyl ester carboxylesterase